MRVVYLATGAGGMYCGGCIHSNTLAASLIEAGQEVLLTPVYTPLRTDEENVSIRRTAFGGINVYLQEKSALFRRTPRSFDRLWDWPPLLRWLGRRTGATRPDRLGPMAVSMLKGEEGRQRKELEKLLDWLEREARPDVVHLSNTLLAGTARPISRRLKCPVVSTLAGEDGFLEQLPEPHRSEARGVLRRQCAGLASLVAMSRYYADFMAGYLAVDRDSVHVIPPGLNLDGHGLPHTRQLADRFAVPQPPGSRPAAEGPGEVTIGYLGRICPQKGLHVLAEAFEQLAGEAELPPLRLRAGGYLAKGDRGYLAGIQSRLARRGLADRFECVGELDRPAKIAFLGSLDVASMPSVYPESKGLSVLEAWANAVPVVLPALGPFSELVHDTGGGLLFTPGDPAALAQAIRQLIEDPGARADYGRRGQEAVRHRYHARLMAQRTVALYEKVVGDRRPGP
jgi:glycosyltransferase involved in cell wall biosynthesis